MEFLRKSIEQTSRKLKFQEWILLALRCLALLLLALALARPTMTSSGSAGRGEAIDAILVLDTSYSMAARDGEMTRFARAQAAATAVIDGLPPSSTVQILTCSDRITTHGPVSPRNLDQARQIIANLKVTSQSSDFLPAISESLSGLDRAVGSQKEVYFFSDMQKTGWERQAGAVRAKAEELKQRATVLLVRCGDAKRTPSNAVLFDLTVPGSIPHTGTRMPFVAFVKNNGSEAVRNLTVTLEVDGKQEKESEQIAELLPGAVVPVTLTAKLDEAGSRVITARLSGDELAGDNQIDRVVMVRETVRVLVIDGAPDQRDPRESGSHYIRNALVPISNSQKEDYFVKVTVVPVDEAGPGLLGACDICVLCDVPASDQDRPGVPGMNKEFVDRLEQFVRDGGGLIIGMGDHVVPDRYNLLLGSRGKNLLPFDLQATKIAQADLPTKFAPDSAAVGSFMERFREAPYSTITADVDVIGSMSLVEVANTSRVHLRYVDHWPAIVSKTIGEGEVIMVTTGLDSRWSNWPAKAGSFLSFVQLCMSHLTGRGTKQQNHISGESLLFQPLQKPDTSTEKGFDLIPPSGKRTKLSPATIDNTTKKLSITVADTSQAGVYQILTAETKDSAKDKAEKNQFLAQYAVIPDHRESDDLTVLSDDDITKALGFQPMFIQAGTNSEQTIKTERSRREWTIGIFLALFVIAAIEAIWAWLCGKAW